MRQNAHTTSASPTVLDFLSECAIDHQSNRLQPLAHYLARYPGHAESIAREYIGLVDARDAPDPASRQLGRYELLRELARGGQGRVYLARDPAVGRFVALKVLDATCGNDIARRERFRREIDAVLRIDHPHVCRLLAAEVDHTPPYAAMELLPGRSLADLLSADGESHGLIEPHGRLQWVKFATFFELVAVAVHAVHQVGIVHRDLKPANLMVTPECEPRVLDFGLASNAERVGELTMTDTLVGTLPYMAPEQLVVGSAIDRRVDVFALGLLMLECALRERAFDGRTPETRLASIRQGVPWRLLRQLHPDLRAIVVRSLATRPEDRYPTCEEFAADLRRWRERRPVHARRTGRLVVAGRWCVRHPWLSAWLAVTACAVAATWFGLSAAREELAESRRLEAGITDAVRSMDSWGPNGAANSFVALDALRSGFDARGATRQRLALLELGRGRLQSARSLVERRDGEPMEARDAALLFACDLVAREDEDSALPALPPVDLQAFADQLAAIAGELYQHARWQPFDAVTEGALQCFLTPDLLRNRYRLPLILWQVQGACARRNAGDALLFDAEKQRLARLHGHDSDEVAEAEERFLQIAFQVVPGTFLRESLRLRAMSAAATVLDKESDRYLRRRAFALAVSLRVRPEAIAELAELREELLARMGEGHPDVIRTTWLFGRQILEFDRERAVALLAEAWSRAEGLPAGHEELQANVLRDHAACLDRQLDAETATKLGRQVLRLHMRLWGLGDPRTHEALACVSLDPGRLPDASAWYEQGLASIPRDEPGDELRFRILERRLGAHANTPRLLACEQYALEFFRGADVARTRGSHASRMGLARLWLRTHDYRNGDTAVPALQESIRRWRLYLGADGPGDLLATEMLATMGAERLERGELADAEPLLQAAAHAAARELGQDDADWLIAAESLPTSQTRFRELCLALARLSGSLGRYEACLRLWRRVLPESTLHERIAGHSPHTGQLREFAWALVRHGDHAEAEHQLERALVIQAERAESAVEVALTRSALLNLYIVSDQPEKAAEQRRLLAR